MTNIARDITEDAEMDRSYLPHNWIEPSTIQAAMDGDSASIAEVDSTVKRLLDLAEQFYESAFEGLWYIRPGNRPAIYFASMLYREIGQSLLNLGRGAWRKRRILSTFEKCKVCWRAFWQYRRMKKTLWTDKESPKHRAELMNRVEAAGIQIESLKAS